MNGSLHALFNFHLDEMAVHFVTLVVAFLIALPVGWDRERATRAVGLRTFPLVAVASASYVVIARALGDDAESHSRILQGLITGIGFIGGGAILKQGNRVRGTATAAALWSTAAIGAAVAYGRIDVALMLSALVFVALRLLAPIKRRFDRSGAALEELGRSPAR